jgi:hypothetical protein
MNLGFQLSFFATLGIILSAPLGDKINGRLDAAKKPKILVKILKVCASSFLITTAATVFTLPFVTYSFGALSLVSPLTNLLTAPLITAVLFLALCIMIFSFAPFMLFIFCVPVYFITKILLAVTGFLGSFKYSYIPVESTNGTGFHLIAAVFLLAVILCFIIKKPRISWIPRFTAVLLLVVLCGTLIYPRLYFADSLRVAYYSNYRNQSVIMFRDDYDYADIIDITHGTLSHARPVYDIMTQNGAMRINSVILTDYRKRHVQMIRRYQQFSDITTVYAPVPKNNYDREVMNTLYNLSVSQSPGFDLELYDGSLMLGEVLITVHRFNFNKMFHQAVEIEYAAPEKPGRLLYLGIGYKEGYERHTDLSGREFDVVFYGSHKRNFRDDDYVANIAGSYAGVLSSYLDNDKNAAAQKLGAAAVEAYLSGSLLMRSDDFCHVVFDIRKNGRIRHYIK